MNKKQKNSKGFILTGILFGLALILLIYSNYLAFTSVKWDDSTVLQIDAVNNRKTDVRRIIKDAISDGHCSDLEDILNNPLLDSDGVEVTINNIDLTNCPSPSINVSISSEKVYEEYTFP